MPQVNDMTLFHIEQDVRDIEEAVIKAINNDGLIELDEWHTRLLDVADKLNALQDG